jgi:hypothetical protein
MLLPCIQEVVKMKLAIRCISLVVVLFCCSAAEANTADSSVPTKVQQTEISLSAPLTEMVSISADKPAQRLSDVKKIFVASLGTAEGSELIRQKLINRLITTRITTLVDSAEDADATLTGAAEINKRMSFSGAGYGVNGSENYSAEIVVRLIGKNKQVLWTYETTTRGLLFGGSPSVNRVISKVAEKVTKDLTKAIEINKTIMVKN